ncbi:hypothetical protein EYF80_031538 [Liparis tanakae]|uniref:Uncharacterized protein n=1 Tax=Liparis tanakae TaxID=230148 RepID=A0A4Z2GXI0_9TELE|nr:hypothetical protein EYF80_031538 [Liparis tanakae]
MRFEISSLGVFMELMRLKEGGGLMSERNVNTHAPRVITEPSGRRPDCVCVCRRSGGREHVPPEERAPALLTRRVNAPDLPTRVGGAKRELSGSTNGVNAMPLCRRILETGPTRASNARVGDASGADQSPDEEEECVLSLDEEDENTALPFKSSARTDVSSRIEERRVPTASYVTEPVQRDFYR